MWTLILGYSFSVIFEDSAIKLFKNNFSFRVLTYAGSGVGWLYQEHVKNEYYEITGAKKFTSEHEFRYRILTQSLLIWKYFCVYTHFISILEFGTFSLLFSFYGLILIKHYSHLFSILEEITSKNYLKLVLRKICRIKIELFKVRYWTLNDKLFFSALFFLFKYGFLKIYGWLDFFVFFRGFFILFFVLTILFSIFLPNYLIYNFLKLNFPKNISLILKLFAKKLIFYFLFFSVGAILIVSDVDTSNTFNENFFKEFFFKIVIFLLQVS